MQQFPPILNRIFVTIVSICVQGLPGALQLINAIEQSSESPPSDDDFFAA